MHPAYAPFLPAVTAAVGPELTEFAGLPGAPARISQVARGLPAGTRQQHRYHRAGNPARRQFIIPDRARPAGRDQRPVRRQLAETLGLQLARDVILGGDRRPAPDPSQAELAVIAGSVRFPPSVEPRDLAPLYGQLLPQPGSPADLAARRFAALSPAARHAWLAGHLTALRAGRISLAQLP